MVAADAVILAAETAPTREAAATAFVWALLTLADRPPDRVVRAHLEAAARAPIRVAEGEA